MPFDQHGYAAHNASTKTAERNGRRKVWPYAGLFLLVALWCTSVVMFGVPGLYIPAVIATPVLAVLLIRITQG